MKRNSIWFAGAAALMLTAARVFAWGDTGHMVVAEIAWENLTPAARAEAERLLAVNVGPMKSVRMQTNTFVTAACWADDVKSNATREWHYSDIAFSPDGTKPQLQPVKGDVVGAIEAFAKQVGDKTLPDEQRARALRYLLHFVGDIHQPLHCVTRCTAALPQGDRGGNDFKVKGEVNLHAYWDGGVGVFARVLRPLSADGQAIIKNRATEIQHAFPKSSLGSAAKSQSRKTWQKESFEAAKSVAYNLPEGTKPTAQYEDAARQLVRKRVALAGYRLAGMLSGRMK